LTLVLPKTADIPHDVTAGRDTVALRAPSHALTLMLLRILDLPIAGPSANKSSHVSPTTAQHVRDELGGEVDMILDGGPCDVGIESTVLDLSSSRPAILRPGGVTREQIETIIGPVDLFTGAIDPAIAAGSPGQHEKHYAPRTPAYRFDPNDRARVSGAILDLERMRTPTRGCSTRAFASSINPARPQFTLRCRPTRRNGWPCAIASFVPPGRCLPHKTRYRTHD
jgi:L-threonylcarbamoyladenylate synthase